MKVSYNWLQQAYFTESLPTPDEVAGVLGTRIFELEGTETVGGDTVLEFDVLPNRAHDCLSHIGIAREINVLFDRTDFCERDQIVEKYTKENVYNTSDKKIACVIENPTLVRRHVGRVIENIKVGESPAWLQDFLKSLGQRSINNVVDATNYVMLSLGQPNHVFDLDKFSGDTLYIRSAQEGEVVTTLDKREVKLIAGDLVLADSEGALDIAGIKGGTKAELGSTTTNILLSAANFDPAQIRKTARRTGVLTDASKRFENEPTPELCMPAIESLTTLILALAGTPETRVGEIVDEYPSPVIPWTVAFTLLELNLLLGTELDNATVSEILQKFGFAYAEENNLFTVHIPVYRLDLKIKEDLIEEIGRVYGYEKIENKSTDSISYTPAINPLVALQDTIRGFLLEKDFSEVMTYSFVNTGEVQVLHPVAEDKSYLRTTIHQQLSESLEKNAYYAPLLGLDDIRIFEMGSVFTTAGEKIVLCLGYDPLIPKKRKQGTAEFLKNILSELETETGYELVQHIRYTGDLVIEVDLSLVLQSTSKIVEQYAHIGTTQISQARFTPISPFPFMTRDIAVWLPTDVAPTVLADLILTHAGALLVNAPRLVDQFEKEGRVSYSYRLVFQSYEKTLVDTEINAIMEEIYTACKQLGFETR